MRDIKFRFWNPEEKTIFYPTPSHRFWTLNTERLIPMQYTGLKDKNGKEIYEGDILSDLEVLDVNEEGEAELDYKIVVYDEDRCFFGLLEFNDPCPILFDEYYIDELEVVGNVYEDKDKFDLVGFNWRQFL